MNKSNNQKVSRHFMTTATKDMILKLYMEGKTGKEISNQLNIKTRQVNNYIKEYTNHQSNVFTENDDLQLAQIYQTGIVKESKIAKIMTTKAPWMIRNRIKYLKKIGAIKKMEINVENGENFNKESVSIPKKEEKDKGLEDITKTVDFSISEMQKSFDELSFLF